MRPFAFRLIFSVWLLSLVALFLDVELGCATGETGFGGVGGDAGPFNDPGNAPTASSVDATFAPAPGDEGGGFVILGPDDASASTGDAPSRPSIPPEPPFDAGEGGLCARPLGQGDLVIVEIMIASTSGTGDHGEWLEVRSALGCAVNLRGLHGECPTGAKVNSFTVADDLWLPAMGTFVVADSIDPAIDHALPGALIPWTGQPGDVLRNKGATVTLLANGAIIDSVTYPALKLTTSASLSFPSNCALTLRTDWTQWQTSTASWFPGFLGTPNGPNDDVQCPSVADQ